MSLKPRYNLNIRKLGPSMFLVPFLLLGLFFTHTLSADEKDNGIVIIDNKPWKVSWVQESNEWILQSYFKEGILKTYFKKEPPMKGLGISSENQPFKQEFTYYPLGKTLTSRKKQFEQWPDGAKAWAFMYDEPVIVPGDRFSRYCTTAIIQEVAGATDEIRYSFCRGELN